MVGRQRLPTLDQQMLAIGGKKGFRPSDLPVGTWNFRVFLREIAYVEAGISIRDEYFNQNGRLKLMADFCALLQRRVLAIEHFCLGSRQVFRHRKLIDTDKFDSVGRWAPQAR